jgi:1-acyl-sn-glycerol-3-phosphate acyltransferase
MFYFRAFLILAWFFLCSFGWIVMSLIRWGDINLNGEIARFYARVARRLAGFRIVVEGREILEAHQPCIYVANHQSALDTITIGSIFPRKTVTIGKKELRWIPFFGIAYAASGNILIDRQDRRQAISRLGVAVRAIRERGASILIFPEGTRNRTGEGILPFKKGAFHMAIEAQVPIVPIVCSPLKDIANARSRKLRGGVVRLRVLPPIQPSGGKSPEALCGEVRERMLEAIRGLSDSVHP